MLPFNCCKQAHYRGIAHYLAHPEELGESASARVANEGLHRTVCDYVSGFTDRYLLEEAGRVRRAG